MCLEFCRHTMPRAALAMWEATHWPWCPGHCRVSHLTQPLPGYGSVTKSWNLEAFGPADLFSWFGLWRRKPCCFSWLCHHCPWIQAYSLPSMSLPSDRMPATPPWHLAVKQEWCVVDRAAQSGKALAERWEAAFLAQVPPPGFEPTFLFSPFSNSLFLRQDLAKRELFYVMKTPVTEKWDLGPKWCVESRSPATLCKVLIGDTGASSLAPDHEHPTWELQQ